MQPLSSLAWRLASLMTKSAKPRVRTRLRITIRRHGDPHITTYDLDQPLGESNTPTRFSYDGKSVTPHRIYGGGDDNMPIEPFMLALAERLYTIPGVMRRHMTHNSGIKILGQSILVVKDRSRTDNDIEADIVRAIAEVFGIKTSEIEVSFDALFAHYRENGQDWTDTIRRDREAN